MTNEKKLFLLDAYALIYRAYYAMFRSPMYSDDGFCTSTLYGFVSVLQDLLSKEHPSHLAVVFDPSGPTFRHEAYPAYKANRPSTPEEIKVSVPVIKEFLAAYKIPAVQADGYEADDVVGTLSRQAAEEGYTVFMMTPDKDYVQLVGDRVFMYKPRHGGSAIEVWDAGTACAHYGISRPEQMIDLLALMGDSSDNVPGARGIGPKGAVKLLETYGTVENLLSHVDELTGSLKAKVQESHDNILLSKELVTICTHVPIQFSAKEFEVEKPDVERLAALFRKYSFRSFLSRLQQQYGAVPAVPAAPAVSARPEPVQGPRELSLFDDVPAQATVPASAPASAPAVPETPAAAPPQEPGPDLLLADLNTRPHVYHVVETEAERCRLAETLKHAGTLAVQAFAVPGPVPDLAGFSLAVAAGESWYVPVPEEAGAAQAVLAVFKDLLEDESITKAGYDLKPVIKVFAANGIRVQGPLFDVMLAHYLLQPELRHDFQRIAAQALHYQILEPSSYFSFKNNEVSHLFRSVPSAHMMTYACEQADISAALVPVLRQALQEVDLVRLAEEVEMPLVYVLADMEMEGVTFSRDNMTAFGRSLQEESARLEQEIFEWAGTTFNLASPKQLGDVLFGRLQLADKVKKTKNKQFSTSEEVLLKLAERYPEVEKILEYRSLKKLFSSYVDALPQLISPVTGRIHTTFNQAVTATGRLSSTDPNLQNIPVREARGRELRRAFVPSKEDRVILAADYSQIELRLMAALSEDPSMTAAFRHDADIHSWTASKIYNVAIADVTHEMRSKAKTANFGIIYGISAFGLAQRMHISRTEATAFIADYFRVFPGVQRYMREAVADAVRLGYVCTLMGRRRYLPDITSRNANVRGMAERNAINAPVQGTAADIIKMAMVAIHRGMRARGLKARMILQVHDELVFDVPKDELEEVKELVREAMEHVMPLEVPLTVSMGVGSNWLEAHG